MIEKITRTHVENMKALEKYKSITLKEESKERKQRGKSLTE
jgi:hypothetical protein